MRLLAWSKFDLIEESLEVPDGILLPGSVRISTSDITKSGRQSGAQRICQPHEQRSPVAAPGAAMHARKGSWLGSSKTSEC